MREKKWVYSSTDAHIFSPQGTKVDPHTGLEMRVINYHFFCEVITGLTVVVVVMHRIGCICVSYLVRQERERERGASVRVCIATDDFNGMSTAIINNKSN
jgi:hypothetical protein